MKFYKLLLILSLCLAGASSFAAPSATMISFIKWMSPDRCEELATQAAEYVLQTKGDTYFFKRTNEFIRREKAEMAIKMLCASSNTRFPPGNLELKQYREFIESKQYRGILTVHPGQLRCDAGVVTKYKRGRIFDLPGYTPLAVRTPIGQWTPMFEEAEKGKVTDIVKRDGGCVIRQVTARSRIRNLPGGIVSKAALINMPPWISRQVTYRQCCDASRNDVKFRASHFPSHRAYVGRDLKARHEQTGFVKFLATQGGTDAQRINMKEY